MTPTEQRELRRRIMVAVRVSEVYSYTLSDGRPRFIARSAYGWHHLPPRPYQEAIRDRQLVETPAGQLDLPLTLKSVPAVQRRDVFRVTAPGETPCIQ